MFKSLQAILLSLMLSGVSWAQPAVDTRPPDLLVREVSEQVLATLRADKSATAADITRINQLIDQQLAPHTDLERTTQITLGRHWANASPQQRSLLSQEVRTLLVLVYAGALRNFSDQTIEYRPFRAAPGDTDVVVRTFVVNKGNRIPVDYRLYRTPLGWKVYDVNVTGLWLTEAYRNQFAPILNEGGVERLLQVLQERNLQLTGVAGRQ